MHSLSPFRLGRKKADHLPPQSGNWMKKGGIQSATYCGRRYCARKFVSVLQKRCADRIQHFYIFASRRQRANWLACEIEKQSGFSHRIYYIFASKQCCGAHFKLQTQLNKQSEAFLVTKLVSSCYFCCRQRKCVFQNAFAEQILSCCDQKSIRDQNI